MTNDKQVIEKKHRKLEEMSARIKSISDLEAIDIIEEKGIVRDASVVLSEDFSLEEKKKGRRSLVTGNPRRKKKQKKPHVRHAIKVPKKVTKRANSKNAVPLKASTSPQRKPRPVPVNKRTIVVSERKEIRSQCSQKETQVIDTNTITNNDLILADRVFGGEEWIPCPRCGNLKKRDKRCEHCGV